MCVSLRTIIGDGIFCPGLSGSPDVASRSFLSTESFCVDPSLSGSPGGPPLPPAPALDNYKAQRS